MDFEYCILFDPQGNPINWICYPHSQEVESEFLSFPLQLPDPKTELSVHGSSVFLSAFFLKKVRYAVLRVSGHLPVSVEEWWWRCIGSQKAVRVRALELDFLSLNPGLVTHSLWHCAHDLTSTFQSVKSNFSDTSQLFCDMHRPQNHAGMWQVLLVLFVVLIRMIAGPYVCVPDLQL